MENFDITQLIADFDLVTAALTAGALGLVFLIRKLPTKVQEIVVKLIDKTDAELDKKKETESD